MPDLFTADVAWYCFQAQSKREHLAADFLNREAEIETFAPRISYIKRTRRGKVRFVDPLFPGYLFVRADLREYYRWIMAAHGIRRLVAYGEKVPRIPDSFIEELRLRLSENQLKEIPEPLPKPGMRVMIAEGPFANWEAVISGEVRSRDRVRLLLDFLGRQLEVETSLNKIIVDSKAPRMKVWEH